MKKLIPVLLALLLSACGGSDNDSGANMPPPVAQTPATEPFFVRVMTFVGQMSDDTEPVDVSAVVVTAPDDTEPGPV